MNIYVCSPPPLISSFVWWLGQISVRKSTQFCLCEELCVITRVSDQCFFAWGERCIIHGEVHWRLRRWTLVQRMIGAETWTLTGHL